MFRLFASPSPVGVVTPPIGIEGRHRRAPWNTNADAADSIKRATARRFGQLGIRADR